MNPQVDEGGGGAAPLRGVGQAAGRARRQRHGASRVSCCLGVVSSGGAAALRSLFVTGHFTRALHGNCSLRRLSVVFAIHTSTDYLRPMVWMWKISSDNE